MINTSEYIGSFPDLSFCPTTGFPEYAFIGRSNVGKSSLINMLCNKKGLALTSGKPGKTQMINYFIIDEAWYLVDLPGFGYARTSKVQRAEFGKMIQTYMLSREDLTCVFLLIDSCVPPQKIDIDFANFLGENGIPFKLVFTKTDKKKRKRNDDYITAFKDKLLEFWEELPQLFVTSAETGQGRDEILDTIKDINQSL